MFGFMRFQEGLIESEVPVLCFFSPDFFLFFQHFLFLGFAFCMLLSIGFHAAASGFNYFIRFFGVKVSALGPAIFPRLGADADLNKDKSNDP